MARTRRERTKRPIKGYNSVSHRPRPPIPVDEFHTKLFGLKKLEQILERLERGRTNHTILPYSVYTEEDLANRNEPHPLPDGTAKDWARILLRTDPAADLQSVGAWAKVPRIELAKVTYAQQPGETMAVLRSQHNLAVERIKEHGTLSDTRKARLIAHPVRSRIFINYSGQLLYEPHLGEVRLELTQPNRDQIRFRDLSAKHIITFKLGKKITVDGVPKGKENRELQQLVGHLRRFVAEAVTQAPNGFNSAFVTYKDKPLTIEHYDMIINPSAMRYWRKQWKE